LGAFLAERRIAHDRTQEDMARILGIAQQTWGGFERNDMALTREEIATVAKALHENPAPWLTAAGYETAESPVGALSEGSPPAYGTGGGTESDSRKVSIYLLEVNHRTGRAKITPHKPGG